MTPLLCASCRVLTAPADVLAECAACGRPVAICRECDDGLCRAECQGCRERRVAGVPA